MVMLSLLLWRRSFLPRLANIEDLCLWCPGGSDTLAEAECGEISRDERRSGSSATDSFEFIELDVLLLGRRVKTELRRKLAESLLRRSGGEWRPMRGLECEDDEDPGGTMDSGAGI